MFFIYKTIRYFFITLVLITPLFSSSSFAEEQSHSIPTTQKLPLVEITSYQATKKQHAITLYGTTQAARRVDLKAEVIGKITSILAKEGSIVKKGDIILQLETRDLAAKLAEAQAREKQRSIEYESSKKLGKQGLSAETKIAESAALLEQAKAQRIQAAINLTNTQLKAPFDGWLEKIYVEEGDLVGPGINTGQGTFNDGVGIVTIIDRTTMLAVGQITEHQIHDIAIGQPATITLVNNATLEGTVSFVGSIADPVTRTFRVEATIHNTKNTIPSGSTAQLSIPIREIQAHHIPSSLLVLNKEGVIGIKAIQSYDNAYKVVFHPITLINSDAEGVWVSDLPPSLNIISRGQAFVMEDALVDITQPTPH